MIQVADPAMSSTLNALIWGVTPRDSVRAVDDYLDLFFDDHVDVIMRAASDLRAELSLR